MKWMKICQNAINVKAKNLIKKDKNVKNAMEQEKLHKLSFKMFNPLLMKRLKHFVLHKSKRFSKIILNLKLE